MAAIARMGVPVVYYVTPQVWAWRAGRMKTLQRHVSLALPIFPFEAPLYRARRHPGPVPRPSAGRRRARRRRPIAPTPRRCRPGAASSGSTRSARRSRCCRAAGTTRSRGWRRCWRPRCRSSPRGCRGCRPWWRARPATPITSSPPLAAATPAARLVRGRVDDVLSARRRRRHRVGHGHGRGRPARASDGRRLQAVAADLLARQAARDHRHLRDGQPGGGGADRARAHPGCVHARGRGRRDRRTVHRSRPLGAHAGPGWPRHAPGSGRQGRPRAWPTPCWASSTPRGSDRVEPRGRRRAPAR